MSLKILSLEIFFFFSTLFLGILIASDIVLDESLLNGKEEYVFSPVYFVIYFLLATLMVFLISSLKKAKRGKEIFFRVAFLLSVIVGGYITLSYLFSDLVGLFILIPVFLWRKKPYILLHNILIVLGISGIGATIGVLFEPFHIVLLLLFFSIYDFIAVYKTKHMVKMAKEMIRTKAIMGFIIPSSFSLLLDDFSKKEKGEFAVLGGGDIAFPLFLCASVSTFSLWGAFFIALFSSLGVILSFYIFLKKRKPIPALPPISFFTVLGYLAFTLLY